MSKREEDTYTLEVFIVSGTSNEISCMHALERVMQHFETTKLLDASVTERRKIRNRIADWFMAKNGKQDD